MAEAPTQVRLCCDHVANAVFPHHNDKARRDQLALALDGLAKAAIAALETRVTVHHKCSFPQGELAPMVVKAVREAIERKQLRGLR
jgi:hypothetical protein